MTATEAQRADRARWISLYVLCTGMLMIVLDVTVVNVALPSIQSDLGFSSSSLAWVVNAYLVPFGGLLLLAGRLSDLAGRKRLFVGGLIGFVLASVACGASQSQEMLIAARFVQGVSGAFTSAVILGMIVTTFPEAREQAKAIGAFTFVAVAGGTIGLLVGGVLTEAISWHWIFFVNVPIGLVTVALAARLIERDHGLGFSHGADLPGAALITSALMLGVYAIVKAADAGWTATSTLALGGVSVALLVLFTIRESMARTPLIDLAIFRAPNVAAANVVQGLAMVGLFGEGFLGALYLQRVLEYTPVQVGFAFLPATLIMGVLSLRFAEPVITRFGPKRVLVVGLTLVAVSLALLVRVPVDGDFVVDFLPAMVLEGFGAGLAFPALMMLAMLGTTPENAGLASGLINTTQQVGGALGLAVLATLSATHTADLTASGESAASALTSGYHLAFLIGTGCVAGAVLIALVAIRLPAATDAALEPASARGAQDGATSDLDARASRPEPVPETV